MSQEKSTHNRYAEKREERWLSANDLELMVNALGREKKLKFVPTNRWGFDATQGAIYFDRGGLMNMPASEASGIIYRKIGHAHYSQGKKDPWSIADRVKRIVDRKVGQDLIHPRSVISLFRMLEEERVERIQRTEYPGLATHDLPRRDQNYRARAFNADLMTLHTALVDGSRLPQLDIETNVPAYWIRAGIAVQALASGIAIDLPEDMPWDAQLQQDIRALGDTTSVDDLMTQAAAIIPRLVHKRLNSNAPEPQWGAPGEGVEGDGEGGEGTLFGLGSGEGDPGAKSQGEGAGEGGEGKPGKGKSGQGKGKGKSSQQKGDKGQGQQGQNPAPGEKPGEREKMQGETKDQKAAEKAREEVDFTRDSADKNDAEAEERLAPGGKNAGNESSARPSWDPPAWMAVKRSAAPIVGAIRKAVRNHFLLNVIGENEGRLRRGRFDAPEAIHVASRGRVSQSVFAKERIIDTRKYHVYLLIDVSGSMSGATNEQIADATVFGENSSTQAWMLAGRLAVALADTFESYGVQVGFGVHDTKFTHVKDVVARWNGDLKQRAMTALQPAGGTQPTTAYDRIRTKLFPNRQARRLLIHLTDGCFYGNEKDSIAKMHHEGIEVVVLTIGMSPDSAIACGIPPTHAAQIDDERILPVLTKHFRRMITA